MPQLTKRESSAAELELQLRILRLQVRGLLKQRVRLNQLPLVKIDRPQLAQSYRLVRHQPEHLTIILLGPVILLGG